MIQTKIDYTGMMFGNWLVLGRVPDKQLKNRKETAWYCECQCDKRTKRIKTRSNLTNGSQSCGCLRDEKIAIINAGRKKQNKYDLTGKYGIGWPTNSEEPFYFDLEDYELIKNYTWYKGDSGYIETRWHKKKGEKGKNNLFLHTLIFDTKVGRKRKNTVVDHKDRNRLNNRKQNLREATYAQNVANSSKSNANKTGVKGVTQIWVANLKYNGKQLQKNCKSKEEAIKQRLIWEVQYYGKFAPQQHLFEEYGINPEDYEFLGESN